MLDRMLSPAWPRSISLLVLAGLTSVAVSASSAPIVCAPPECKTWNGDPNANGHSYMFVALTPDITWSAANTMAQGATPLSSGSGATLASINYQAEQQFIQNTVLPAIGVNRNQVWIGGQQADGGPSPTADWAWVSGIVPESWNYTNWTSGEPNDEFNVNERFLTMWVHYYTTNAQDLRGSWNDSPDLGNPAAPIMGMIVEWGVPEPTTAALSVLGLSLLALRRRRSG